ncbi:MAG TPA: trigger factor [Planctomycetota bacterium]|nr:trigger factor [Planctomycetota bacterium]
MDIHVKDLGRCKKEISVVVPAEAVAKDLDEGMKNLRQQIALPGFRPGKTPISILEKRFGEEIGHTVAAELVQKAMERAVSERNLELVSEAELVEKHLCPKRGEPLTFTVTVEVKPDIEPAGYRGLEVERERKPVEDADVDRLLESLRRDHADLEPTSEGFSDDDVASGTVRGEVGGKVFENEGVHLAGSGMGRLFDYDIEGYLDALKGKKAGDVLTFDGRVGAMHPHAEAGLPAKVVVTIKDVMRPKLPAVDDAFAEKLGQPTVLALRTEIRKKLEEARDAEAERRLDESLIDRVIEKNPFEMADGPVARAVENRMHLIVSQLKLRGMDERAAVEEVEKRREEFRKEVERDARGWLLVEKIAKKEKIFALEDDVAREYERIARERGDTPTSVRRRYEEEGLTGGLRAEILEKKVKAFLRSHAKVTDRASEAAAGG